MDKGNFSILLKNTIEVVQEVGQWMRTQRVAVQEIETKTPNNLVSFVDKESERRLVTAFRLIFPEAGFIAEEGTGVKAQEWNWVIDPLDGTTNYLHGVPIWCISVALCHHQDPVLAVIYDPNRDELFRLSKEAVLG